MVYDFLRHLERTRILIHLIDLGNWEYEPDEAFRIINRELELYSQDLSQKPQVVAANKIDLPQSRERLEALKKELDPKTPVLPISAVTGEGVQELLYRVQTMLEEIKLTKPPSPLETSPPETWKETRYIAEKERFKVTLEDGVYVVAGAEVERHVAMTNMENDEAVRRLQRIFQRMGVDDALREAGVQNGDGVRIGDLVFDFVEPYE